MDFVPKTTCGKWGEILNIKEKLLSRKFCLAFIGFVAPLVLAYALDGTVAIKIFSFIMSDSCLIAYIISEGMVDANKQLKD